MCIRDSSITIPAQGDDFDPIRVEYTQMLQNQLARGNNGPVSYTHLDVYKRQRHA